MNGVELARYVRERWPPTIIVVSSGKYRLNAGELADDMAFISKPHNDVDLRNVIGEVKRRLAHA
jgi:hypothetical protein